MEWKKGGGTGGSRSLSSGGKSGEKKGGGVVVPNFFQPTMRKKKKKKERRKYSAVHGGKDGKKGKKGKKGEFMLLDGFSNASPVTRERRKGRQRGSAPFFGKKNEKERKNGRGSGNSTSTLGENVEEEKKNTTPLSAPRRGRVEKNGGKKGKRENLHLSLTTWGTD